MKGVMGKKKYNQDFSQTSAAMLCEEVTWDVFSRDADIGHLWQHEVVDLDFLPVLLGVKKYCIV